MPIYLRKFYTDKLIDARKAENSQAEKASRGKGTSIQRPG